MPAVSVFGCGARTPVASAAAALAHGARAHRHSGLPGLDYAADRSRRRRRTGRFTGRNVTPEWTWETRSQVVGDPGREFAFQLRGSWTRWGYTFEPVDGGTRLTESWHFPPDAVAGFRERYGEEADARLEIHKQQMREGIPATLAAIKAAAEDIAAIR
ncbi:MAG: hypothetical protein M3Y73_04595 [Actinomycetota bacterium]|nr:hypothetical protein [Actinomycetota bacterium]